MTWEPTKLEISRAYREPSPGSEEPGPISNEDRDVTIIVDGSNFEGDGRHFGIFVHSRIRAGKSPSKQEMIACNGIVLREGDFRVSLRICPRRKAAGKYDLYMYGTPPTEVKDRHGVVYKNVPVNDVAFLADAITVIEGELCPPKDKPAPGGEKAAD